MNKKIISAVGISGLLMAGGVLSASASTSGYDLFKTSVKKTQQVKSFTAHVQASLKDNGTEVYSVDSLNKENLKSDSGSSSVTVNNGGKTSQMDFYNNDQQSVVKSSKDNKYYVKQEGEKKWHHAEMKHEDKLSPQKQKDIEAIFDALTKNYQDSITSKDLANGNTELKLDLSKNQIPAVGQAVVSFFLKNLDQQSGEMDKGEFGSLKFADLKPQLPQLKNNISVSGVSLKGEVNAEQYLTGQEAIINVSGDDANGTHHDLVLHLTSNLDNLNNTDISGVDLKGKTVVKVKEQHHRHED